MNEDEFTEEVRAANDKAGAASFGENLLSLLSRFSNELLAVEDKKQAAHKSFETVAELGVDVGLYFRGNGAVDKLYLEAYQGISEADAQLIEQLQVSQTLCGSAVKMEQPFYVSHLRQLDEPEHQWLKEYGIEACVCHPLKVQNRLLGALLFGSRQHSTFSPEMLNFLAAVSHTIALSMAQQQEKGEREHLMARNHDQETQLKGVLESLTDAFYTINSEWCFTYINQKAETLWGRRRETLLGRNIWEAFPQAVGSIPYKAHWRVMRERRAERLEHISPVIGTWINTSIYPTANGGLAVYFQDVTTRKEAEAERERLLDELERERAFLKAVLDQMPSGVIIVDARTDQVVVVNEQVQRILGQPYLPFEQFKNHQTYKFFRPDGTPYELHELPLMRALDTEKIVQGEELICERIDGSQRAVLASAAPIRKETGEVVAGVLVFAGITERKEAEEKLRQLSETLEQRIVARTRELHESRQEIQRSRDNFATLFQSNPIPSLITKAKDGTIVDANDMYLQYFGEKREEIIGKTTVELNYYLAPEDREPLVRAVREKGYVRNAEFVFRHPEQGPRVALVSIETIKSGDEPILLSSFVDITELKRAEEKVRELASALTLAEQKERHRVSQILHEDLQQRLYAIRLQFTFLEDAFAEGGLESLQEKFEQIEESLREGMDLARYLSIDLSPPVLAYEGLQEAIHWLVTYMQERYDLLVELESEEPLPVPDEAVRVLLFQIVRELLFNVVKHAGTTRARVTLQQTNGDILIRVEDKGQGFDIEAVLDPDATVSDKQGLRRIGQRLALLGGQLEIETAPNNGTSITILAPLEHEPT